MKIAAALLGLLLTTQASAPQEVEPEVTPDGLSYGKLEEEIMRSVRWLIEQQDPNNGRYGRGVQDTARSLVALTRCPERYVYASGPHISAAADYLMVLQRADGSIGEPEASEHELRDGTELAGQALSLVDMDIARQAAKQAKEYIPFTFGPKNQGDKRGPLHVNSNLELLRQCEELLKVRKEGTVYWENPRIADGPVAQTAIRIDFLNLRYNVMRQRRELLEQGPKYSPRQRANIEIAMARGANWLHTVTSEFDGLWGVQPGEREAGLTAMATAALLSAPEETAGAGLPAELQETVDRALDWLVSLQKEDGSIHQGQLPNYVTSAAVLAMTKDGREKYAPVVAKARAYLQDLQITEEDGVSSEDAYYGGIGYGNDGRPDLSNLQMAIDALAAAGMAPGDPTYDRAVKFLERCQNRSESNDAVIEVDGVGTVKSGNDGGSAYMPGESKAGYVRLADGTHVPLSYGSMTYALLKSYLFAGLPRDDERVKAAWEWLRGNYTLDINPGFESNQDPNAAYQGLYYYYYTMSRALDLYGDEVVFDTQGFPHLWRDELLMKLMDLQKFQKGGYWVNEQAERWFEGNPVLATSYALLAMDTALPPRAQ